MEALGYSFEMQDEQNVIEKLCNNLLVIQLNDDVVKLVVEIRKSKKIKLPDAIIAASAICIKPPSLQGIRVTFKMYIMI